MHAELRGAIHGFLQLGVEATGDQGKLSAARLLMKGTGREARGKRQEASRGYVSAWESGISMSLHANCNVRLLKIEE
jgi:hypothetical protein